jgi:hypothetical protein
MQQGDMVVVVRRMLSKINEDDSLLGRVGVIVRPIGPEEFSHTIHAWCRWMVLIDGRQEPYEEDNLRVISEGG